MTWNRACPLCGWLKDAQVKARAIADELGVEISNVHQVSEGRTDGIPFESRVMSFDRAKASTSVEPGRVQIAASVSITFQLGETRSTGD